MITESNNKGKRRGVEAAYAEYNRATAANEGEWRAAKEQFERTAASNRAAFNAAHAELLRTNPGDATAFRRLEAQHFRAMDANYAARELAWAKFWYAQEANWEKRCAALKEERRWYRILFGSSHPEICFWSGVYYTYAIGSVLFLAAVLIFL